jgi:hypothetical protein
MLRSGCAFVGHHGDDFGAENLLIKLERVLTVAIEI